MENNKQIEWESIVTMLQALNRNCNYLVMRNFENFEECRLFNKHEDIDILCDDVNLLVNTLYAEPRAINDKVHYKIWIRSEKINLDVRCIGDTYYDANWERDMLKRRIMYKNLFYIPAWEDYYYSLIYHGIVHKGSIKEEYMVRLKRIAQFLEKQFIRNNIKNDLEKYMRQNNYIYTDYKSLS